MLEYNMLQEIETGTPSRAEQDEVFHPVPRVKGTRYDQAA